MKGKEIQLPFGVDFKLVWDEWIEYRKEIRKPYKSEKSIIAVLNTLSKFDEQIAILSIRRSIENQWQGLFPEQIQPHSKQQQIQIDKNKYVSRREGTNNQDQLDELSRRMELARRNNPII